MRKGEEEGGRGNYLWRRRKESAVLTEGDHEVTGGGSGAPGKPAARERGGGGSRARAPLLPLSHGGPGERGGGGGDGAAGGEVAVEAGLDGELQQAALLPLPVLLLNPSHCRGSLGKRRRWR
jgi:hypothetical protein